MEFVIWVLSVQLWSEPPPKIKIVYNKEYATYEECMQAREKWDSTGFKAFCLTKIKHDNTMGK